MPLVKRQLALVRPTPCEATLLDWQTVETAFSRFGLDNDDRSRRFQRYVLYTYFGIEPLHSEECITDGGDDRGIDCVVISDDELEIHLISTKTVREFKGSKRNFPGGEIEKVKSFIDDLINEHSELLTHTNQVLSAKIRRIWDLMGEGKRLLITLHFYSNQLGLTSRDRDRLIASLQRHKIVFKEAHLAELAYGIARTFAPPRNRLIRFAAGEQFEYLLPGVRVVHGIVNASDIVGLVTDPETGELDHRMFNDNVRGHLGRHNSVNCEIDATLNSESRSLFEILNNGIAIVCETYSHQEGSTFPFNMTRPQVVNGGQTAVVLFDASKKVGARLEGVRVAVRIFETRDPSLVHQIAVTTNSQSRILSRDLRANDDITCKLSVGLERLGYQYVRKRGEEAKLVPDRVIDALRAGQLLLAFINAEPHAAKTNSNSIFGHMFERVFDPAVVTAELIGELHELWRVVEHAKQRRMIALRRSAAAGRYGEDWIIEGSFHVLWLAGELTKSSLDSFERVRAARSKVEAAMRIIDRFYKQLERPAAYRIFRSARTVEDLRSFLLATSLSEIDTDQLELFQQP